MNISLERWFSHGLEKCAFLETYPLYTYIVSRFGLRDSSDVDIMAVSGEAGRPVLHINRAYFGESSRYLPGVLLHEIHHVVLGHLTDPRFRTASVPLAMTIAMEISANEDIREPLPGEPIRIEQYTDLGIAPGQSTWQRYELISASMNRDPASKLWIFSDAMDCARAPSGHIHGQSGRAGAIDGSVVEDLINGAERGHDSTRVPARIAGRTPGELLEALGEVMAPAAAALNWTELLQQFAGADRASVYSYARPNRRFPGRVGEVPGRARRCNDKKKKLLAVVDTSASMDRSVLGQVFTELKRLQQHMDVTVVECDAAVQRVYPVSRCSGMIRGRGGTDLRPPFERGFLGRQAADGVVYFTDGAGPYPDRPPPIPTLWVLTDDASFMCPWGQQVRMDATSSC